MTGAIQEPGIYVGAAFGLTLGILALLALVTLWQYRLQKRRQDEEKIRKDPDRHP